MLDVQTVTGLVYEKTYPGVVLSLFVTGIPKAHRIECINWNFGLRQKASTSGGRSFSFCRKSFCRQLLCRRWFRRSDDFGDLKIVPPFGVVGHVHEALQVPMLRLQITRTILIFFIIIVVLKNFSRKLRYVF